MTTTSRPYAVVPPEAARVLRPVLPRLGDETIAAIAREVPDYARAMEGNFGQAVRRGVEVALTRFVDLLADADPQPRESRDTYVALGRIEFHAGRSLDALLAAYRVGARLAWRRFVEAGVEGGLPPSALYALGEAIFAYIDEISAESAEGFAAEQSAAAGESYRRRRRLVRLLCQDPPPPPEVVRGAALEAGWPLPRTLAALVVGVSDGDPEAQGAPLDPTSTRLALRLGVGAVGAEAAGLAVVLVPDPDGPGRRRLLEAGVGDRLAVLGPGVPWGETATSVRRAATAHRLATGGRVPAAGLLVADDHLETLLLAADPAVAADLAAARLAPLAAMPDGQRDRLTETLRAWLDRPGQVQAVAARARRAPADRALPRPPASRAVRARARGSGWALRPRPGAAGPLTHAKALPPAAAAAGRNVPMRLLVTGAAGMLGQDVIAAAERAGHAVVGLGRAELDICDAAAVAGAVRAAAPDAVVNCAAWTDVDGAETAEAAATQVNGDGAGHVAAAADAVGAFVVHVSTDYVFPGTGDRPYAETAPTAPLNAYGRSKLAGEHAVAAAAPSAHAIVRSSWLFGVHGPNFVATMLRLAGERDEVTVVDDQIGCPTYTGHLAPALVEIAERRLGGVRHVAGGEECSWWDLASATFEAAGRDVVVHRGSTADLGRPAPRPAYSALRSVRRGTPVLPPWRDGLAAFLDARVTA